MCRLALAPRPSIRVTPHAAVLSAAVVAALAACAAAQRQFEELPRRGLPAATYRTRVLALADLTGNGQLDLITGNNGQQNRFYLNVGRGEFLDLTSVVMPVDSDGPSAVAVGDVDLDGDLDIVWGNNGAQQNRLLLNSGGLSFTDVTAAQLPTIIDSTTSLAMGDVDGDGDPDLVVGNFSYPGEQSRLYLNDGTGTFVDVTATKMPNIAYRTGDVVMGDLDNDGDLDLVLGNRNEQSRLYLNDGTGTFTDATAGRLQSFGLTIGLGLGDVDGDGDLDLAVANYYYQPNKLFLNDGTATFTDVSGSQMPAVGFPTDRAFAVSLVDVDGDSDLDMVLSNNGQQNRLYENTGTGTFVGVTAARLAIDSGATHDHAVADLDLDGDLDLIFANASNEQNSYYRNLQRQLQADVEPKIGQSYGLDAYLRYGPSSTIDLAAIFMSTGAASIPVPSIGTIGIDPALAAPFPLLTIPQPAGVGSVALAVPNVAGLVGLTVYSQAVLIAYPGDLRLSNVITDVVGL